MFWRLLKCHWMCPDVEGFKDSSSNRTYSQGTNPEVDKVTKKKCNII